MDDIKKEAPISFIEQDIIESRARGQQIVTRFPPEPNGYMHIGHAKAFGISYSLAKKYGGRTNLRFDDTNPAKESMEFVENLTRDIQWLGLEFAEVLFASDYYEKLYQFAVNLIKKGLAYVDDQTSEQIAESRGDLLRGGVESPWRGRSVEENLQLFASMRAGEFADGARVLRAKIDMASPNMNMRDPVIYRIARVEHYRTGNDWCIYPMYDFAHPLSDAIENISHSICSLEFEDHRPLYDWFVAHGFSGGGKKFLPPRQFEFSRLNIDRTVMSKRWLKRFVDDGMVDGWDDPRMPTISGMRRRGYSPKAIMDFVLSTGISKSNMCVPLSALEYYVRAELDPFVTRVSVVFNARKVVITNFENSGVAEFQIANNPHDESAGTHRSFLGKEIYIDGADFCAVPPPKYKRLCVGGAVRLRGAGCVIRCVREHKDYLECEIVEDVKPAGVIQFVEVSTAIPATVYEYFPLLKEGTALCEENLNPVTRICHQVFCEDYLKNAKAGDKFQFVRSGFYCCDKVSVPGKLVFNKTVGLREGF